MISDDKEMWTANHMRDLTAKSPFVKKIMLPSTQASIYLKWPTFCVLNTICIPYDHIHQNGRKIQLKAYSLAYLVNISRLNRRTVLNSCRWWQKYRAKNSAIMHFENIVAARASDNYNSRDWNFITKSQFRLAPWHKQKFGKNFVPFLGNRSPKILEGWGTRRRVEESFVYIFCAYNTACRADLYLQRKTTVTVYFTGERSTMNILT